MNKAAEIILALVIVGVTLAFGGVQPISYSLMEVILFLTVLVLLLRQTRINEARVPLPVWPFLFAGLVVLQLIPLPVGLVGMLSPERLTDWNIGITDSAPRSWATLSVYPHETILVLMRLLAYLSGFVIAAQVFDSRKGQSSLLRILIFLGLFEAGYGIVQYTTGWQKIFTYTKKYDLEEATGTYINRNHFAGLLELIIPLVLASIFYSFQAWTSRRHMGHTGRRDSGRNLAASQSLFYLFLLVLMVVAVIFSRSRMGILVTVFSIVFLALLAQLQLRKKVWMVGVFLFMACVLGYGLWIGLAPVLARFEVVHDPNYLQVEGRVAIWKDTVRLLRDYPLTGSGLGTFGIVFRKYQTALVDASVDHAHNDYLEVAADTGLLGALLLFVPIFCLLGKMVLSFLAEARGYRRAVVLGCIGSTMGLLLHSVTDFNLQIPANALIFSTILGIGYKASCVKYEGEAGPPGGR
ncbi:MAG: O-antigen ligase family protein [Terriglobia bacterium]